MLNVSTGALCAEDDLEVARLLAELSQVSDPSFDKSCMTPQVMPPKNPLIALAKAIASERESRNVQLGSLTPSQAPNHDAASPDTKTPTPSKIPARAAGSKTGKGKVGRKPRLTPLTAPQALARGPFTATELAAARQSKRPKDAKDKGPSAPRHSDAMVETFWHLRWRDLSPAQILTLAARHFALANGQAFSLNLSAEREAELRARADPHKRMAQLLRDRTRAAGFGELPIGWTFEVSPKSEGDRLHLHGVIDLQGIEGSDLSRLKEAMREAAGRVEGKSAARQLSLKPLSYAPGWASYMLKDEARTAAELRLDRSALVYLSNPARRAAEAHFELIKSGAGDHYQLRMIRN